MMSPGIRKLSAELFGTFALVFAGTGAIVINDVSGGTVSHVGIAFTFGLIVLAMIYALGDVSGCHLNPAVTVGLNVGGRFPSAEVVPYIIAQVSGAVIGSAILWFIASGGASWQAPSGAGAFATNGYGTLSPGGYSVQACFIAEVVLTFFFLIIILGSTSSKAPAGFAPIAIGLGLTLIHLISIPVTNTSVNPARSTGPALFAGAEYVGQLWLFWVAPIVGAVIAGGVSRWLQEE